MRATHTPGPWAVEAGWNDPGQFTVTAPTHYSGERGLVASTDGTPWPERREANARLIAAAPEMLATLRDVLDWYAHSTDADGDMPPELHARLIRAVGGEVAPDGEATP